MMKSATTAKIFSANAFSGSQTFFIDPYTASKIDCGALKVTDELEDFHTTDHMDNKMRNKN